MKRLIGASTLCAAIASASPAFSDMLAAQLRDLLERARGIYDFPGATAAIAFADGRVVASAAGFADREAGIPMTPRTPMLAASIGKSFVAMTALSLEDEGLLSRADPVGSHLGERAWFARLPNHRTMTVGDLLRHGAGLPDHVFLPAFQAELSDRLEGGSTLISPEEAISFVLDAEPLFPAGSGWAYTDTGYLLLGLVIEAASGRSYHDLVTERFLVPLGLESTQPSDRRDLPGLAVGYVAAENPFGLPPRTADDMGLLLWDPAVEWTGGGLMSTSVDLAIWGRALFGGLAMDTPYIGRLLDAVPVSPEASDERYGAGVAIHAETPRGPVYGHGGWIPGYVSSLRHYADHGVTVAFQINSDVGTAEDGTELVPALEAALADLAIAMTGAREPER